MKKDDFLKDFIPSEDFRHYLSCYKMVVSQLDHLKIGKNDKSKIRLFSLSFFLFTLVSKSVYQIRDVYGADPIKLQSAIRAHCSQIASDILEGKFKNWDDAFIHLRLFEFGTLEDFVNKDKDPISVIQ